MYLSKHLRRFASREALFFLFAIAIPCGLLVLLTVRMLIQEGELADKRAADERRRLAADVRQELVARVERIASRVTLAAAFDTEVALATTVVADRLVLPWEDDAAPATAARALEEPPFREAIARGEREEFIGGRYAQAADAYRAAVAAGRLPIQKAAAQLHVARALMNGGRTHEAEAAYAMMLMTPAQVVDDQGIPVVLYAALALLKSGEAPQPEREQILESLTRAITTPSLPPAALYMARDVAASLPSQTDINRRISARIQDLEQALELQKRFAALALNAVTQASAASEAIWVSFGSRNNLWLVGSVPRAESPLVIALRAEPLFQSLQAIAQAGPGIRISADDAGEPLSPTFSTLTLIIPAETAAAMAREGRLERPVYLAVLAVVLSTAVFGTYLFSRDVRRELRLAEMRSQFVSSVSHELKTPLTAIRMFAETLLLGWSRGPEITQEYLETIVNESERLTRLLNNVLDFSKIEQGTKTYRLEPHSAAAIVHAAARAMEYPLAQQGFELRVCAAEDLPPVAADPDAIQQALLNLLCNAMKYSGDGRIIEMELTRDGEFAAIGVTDHGIGIPASEHTRIFEKFYRVQSADTRRIAGTGLGLTLVEHVARAHGGIVQVRSAPGVGSTFSLFLPLFRKDHAALARAGVHV